LVKQCKSGNSRAQFKIYQLYYKAMYNTSLRILNNTQDAEDAMQEAFLSAFQKLESYKGEVSFGAWLKKITVNKSLDYIRKRKDEWLISEEQLPEITEENDNIFEDSYKILELKKAIQKLPEGYRIIVSLYYLEGYDHEEISKILSISPITSRTQLSRAKVKLRNFLTKNMENG